MQSPHAVIMRESALAVAADHKRSGARKPHLALVATATAPLPQCLIVCSDQEHGIQGRLPCPLHHCIRPPPPRATTPADCTGYTSAKMRFYACSQEPRPQHPTCPLAYPCGPHPHV